MSLGGDGKGMASFTFLLTGCGGHCGLTLRWTRTLLGGLVCGLCGIGRQGTSGHNFCFIPVETAGMMWASPREAPNIPNMIFHMIGMLG